MKRKKKSLYFNILYFNLCISKGKRNVLVFNTNQPLEDKMPVFDVGVNGFCTTEDSCWWVWRGHTKTPVIDFQAFENITDKFTMQCIYTKKLTSPWWWWNMKRFREIYKRNSHPEERGEAQPVITYSEVVRLWSDHFHNALIKLSLLPLRETDTITSSVLNIIHKHSLNDNKSDIVCNCIIKMLKKELKIKTGWDQYGKGCNKAGSQTFGQDCAKCANIWF